MDAELDGARVTWRPYDGVPAICAASNGRYDHAPEWYRHAYLSAEDARGLDAVEDLAAPGSFSFALAARPAVMVLATAPVMEPPFALADAVFAAERTRRAAFADPITRAAASYLVTRGDGQTVIAGYPWFGDWGRDTFISLRGLCLVPRAGGRREVAASILRQWAGAVSDGMLPNRFSEHGTPEYNSVDAALWFVIAADAYLQGAHADADRAALEPAIDDIVAGYFRGTRHGIGCAPDGLLAAGEPGVQLTWMDARIGDEVVTPRIGKPVEIQALWINALAIAGQREPRWHELAERATAAFRTRFWDDARGQLHDVVDCDHVPGTFDATCRPNMIFAVGGLPLALLEGDRARAVVDTAFAQLWTPAGPRSLSPHDPRYRGRYRGGPVERDRSYHQGPVWPWLAGPFVEAWCRVRGDTAAVRAEARAHFVVPLLARLSIAGPGAGLGHLSEICDGDAPHAPAGCPFQAWSMAELRRLQAIVG
jgi:predicted glycogen debranching enzyme